MSGDDHNNEARHDPTWLNARRYGRWCECSCGWVSPGGSIAFAQDAFGRHLLATRGEVSS